MERLMLHHRSAPSSRRNDLLAVAFCLTLLAAAARAAVPPPFSTFLAESGGIVGVVHDSAQNIYTFGVLSSGDMYVNRLDPGATRSTTLSGFSAHGQPGAMTIDSADNI